MEYFQDKNGNQLQVGDNIEWRSHRRGIVQGKVCELRIRKLKRYSSSQRKSFYIFAEQALIQTGRSQLTCIFAKNVRKI